MYWEEGLTKFNLRCWLQIASTINKKYDLNNEAYSFKFRHNKDIIFH